MGKKKQDPLGGTYVLPVTWAKKTRPARGDLCLTSDVGKKKQDPLGGTYVSPVTWAKKKQDPLGGTYVSPRDMGKKKKQDPLGGTYVSPRDVGKKKTRPTRGDVCLTQRRGQKKTRPMWGRRDSISPPLRDKQYPVPSHWVGEEGLIDTPPPIKGGHGSSPMSPQIRREGLIVALPSISSPC